MTINKKTVKHIAIGAAIGLGAAAIILQWNGAHLLKEAKWTPEGNFQLSFFNKSYDMVCYKPE